MKKVMKLLFIIFCGFFVCIFAGCNKSNEVVNITVKDNSSDIPFEVYVGEVDFSQYYLIVEYESGELVEVNMTKDMISSAEEVKLYRIGSQELDVQYAKKTTKIYFNVNKKELSDLYIEDVHAVYTGDYIEVNVSGNISKNAVIVYPNGNKFKDVGVYEVKALVYEEGYAVKELTSNVVISKATYDMSGINFYDTSVTYDGNIKNIMVEGTLPNGVSVTYEYSNLALSVGSYEVTAKFHGDFDNYESIPDMKATLTITKAIYDMSEIKFENMTFTYDGTPHSLAILNEDLLPEGIEVIYENNSHIDAGEYEVIVSFEGDNLNYEPLETLTAILTINKTKYDLSGINFESCLFKYDGTSKEIEIQGQLPEGVSVTYYIYSSNLEISYDEFPVEVGTYVVVAKFSHSNANYLDIKDMHAIIVIES